MKVVDDEWLGQLVSGVSIPTNDGIEEDSSNPGNAEILLRRRKGKYQMIGGEAEGEVAGAEGGGTLTHEHLGAGSWCHARHLVPPSLTIRQISGPFPTICQPYTASPHPLDAQRGDGVGGDGPKTEFYHSRAALCTHHTCSGGTTYTEYI